MELGRPKIALTVVDLEGSYERLVAAAITPLCPIVSTSVSRFFFITDPDGTPIQLHEFSGNDRGSPSSLRERRTTADEGVVADLG